MRWVISLLFALSTVSAQPALARQAQKYAPINPPIPTDSDEQVEVVEFFWYGCPHCYDLEPDLEKWLENKPDNVAFRRVPAPLNPSWAPHAHFFYAAELLGVSDKLHKPLFEALHKEKRRVSQKDDLVRFAAQRGVDEAEFRKAWDSFAVNAKVQRARQLAARYRITGVPALGINGKYRTGTGMVTGYPELIEVLEELVAKEIAPAESD